MNERINMRKPNDPRQCDLESILKGGKTRMSLNENELKEYIENCLTDEDDNIEGTNLSFSY
jgi:hypothetical protein